MSFTIDLSKNKQYRSLDVEIAEGVKANLPEYTDSCLTALSKDFRQKLPPLGLMVMKDVFVFGNGFIMTNRRERVQSPYLPYTYLTNEKGIKQSSGALRVMPDGQYRTRPLSFQKITGTAALLTQPGDGIFGHWLVDLVPMFKMIQSQFNDITYITKTSVLENHSIPDIQGVFNLIQFDKSKAVGLTENLHAYHCEKLIVPSAVRYGQQIHPYVNELYKDYRLRAYDSKLPEKVYFSRKKWKPSGNHRVLVNCLEVEAYYMQKGFEVIHPEELSFEEKLAIVRNAKEVVGEKGTALHLSLFSDSIKKMTILLSPGEAMTGLPMLQDEICKMQGIACNYIIGDYDEHGKGFVINPFEPNSTVSKSLSGWLGHIANLFR